MNNKHSNFYHSISRLSTKPLHIHMLFLLNAKTERNPYQHVNIKLSTPSLNIQVNRVNRLTIKHLLYTQSKHRHMAQFILYHSKVKNIEHLPSVWSEYDPFKAPW